MGFRSINHAGQTPTMLYMLYPRYSHGLPAAMSVSFLPCCLSFLGKETLPSSGMPSYYLQDCHYFYRTALRGLNISTSISPLYA